MTANPDPLTQEMSAPWPGPSSAHHCGPTLGAWGVLGPKSPGTPAVRPAKHGPGNKQVGSKFSKPRASCVTTRPETAPPSRATPACHVSHTDRRLGRASGNCMNERTLTFSPVGRRRSRGAGIWARMTSRATRLMPNACAGRDDWRSSLETPRSFKYTGIRESYKVWIERGRA